MIQATQDGIHGEGLNMISDLLTEGSKYPHRPKLVGWNNAL